MLRKVSWARLPAKLPRLNHLAGRTFGSTASLQKSQYDNTLNNLKIGSHTRVIFQGFTGKQATANAKESLEWGTNIVGGVTPGREGEHLGLPVLPTVRKAMETLKPDATGIYVAAYQATAAIEEAIEAEVPLIVAVAEHIPLHDFLRIHSMLRTQSKSRVVGANSPGIISSVGKCRIGFQPLPCFRPGRIGIVARSGTLSYETAASTLRSDLGQSMCIGVGGDVLPGTTLLDGLKILVEDEDTEGIALVGEIGGDAEVEAADWIKEYNSMTKNPKPIVAIIGGIVAGEAVPGRIMGHAGAFTLPGEPSGTDKVEALQQAGVAIVNHPSRFGPVLKTMLDGSGPTGAGVSSPFSSHSSQRRRMHTMTGRPRNTPHWREMTPQIQKRNLYLSGNAALDLLRQRGAPISEGHLGSAAEASLVITVNRASRSPCIIVSSEAGRKVMKKIDYDYNAGSSSLSTEDLANIANALNIPSEGLHSLTQLLAALTTLFKEKEAFLLRTHLTLSPVAAVSSADLGFDDAAHRSSKRQADIQARRDISLEDPAEVGVEREGIVYVKLPNGAENTDSGPGSRKGAHVANIGTLVNGAGLAMNTVDALADAGGRAANFLDTGGKATSETVKKSFEVILTDPRVKVIFVNIFGGLTLGDMIARGVVLAFKELHMNVPVVVRIRGTNEKEGQQIIDESGLPLYAFDDFDEAAAKAIELAHRES